MSLSQQDYSDYNVLFSSLGDTEAKLFHVTMISLKIYVALGVFIAFVFRTHKND